MRLGSLTEPLSPRAFPGPGGIPLTPASWAGDRPGAASRHTTAKASNTVLPVLQPGTKIEVSGARFIDRGSLADMPIYAVHGNKLEGAAEVPCLHQKRPQPLHRAALLWSNPDEG